MGFKEIFQKQGGINLIKQYFRNGSLLTAICEFILLGKSRTALEILRLSTQLKVKQRLERKYKKTLEIFDRTYDDSLQHEASNKVWICWFQDMDNAPDLVKKCYDSVKHNLVNKEIVLITADNLQQYVQFPDYIIDKWKAGIITHTHMTDLLRLELLIRYGGLWLDATVLCTSPEKDIPKYFFESDLFFFQSLKPGRDGNATYISSWLINAKTNNKILMATRTLLYEYWRNNNDMDDYFLLHVFMSIVLDKYEDDWKKIIPRDNAAPHILLLRLFEEYDETVWRAIKDQVPFHKLSYKKSEEKGEIFNTYLRCVIFKDIDL
ncbi:capsular polysaccharide synthesis protein [uncultured Anaerovibrio sp.]|uniref:capsular polysaccharide synthesis protein n=1 Tax=uncultured Anaerovibrio sp. TaxID=361586 RepID=UPI0025F0F6D5|nr:capsular polysaccharide synthesis protein [uncultured Anaerovibrio sp.]